VFFTSEYSLSVAAAQPFVHNYQQVVQCRAEGLELRHRGRAAGTYRRRKNTRQGMVRNADGMQLVAYWPIAVSRPTRFLLAFIESIFSPAGRIRFAVPRPAPGRRRMGWQRRCRCRHDHQYLITQKRYEARYARY
jgi:hypothetical protein